MGCNSCDTSGGVVEIVQGYDKNFFVELFYLDSQLPYDLTGVTEIVVALPGTATPILFKLTLGGVFIAGAPGAGRIQVKVTAIKSALMQLNPSGNQPQDLQVAITNADTTHTAFLMPAVISVVPPTYGVV